MPSSHRPKSRPKPKDRKAPAKRPAAAKRPPSAKPAPKKAAKPTGSAKPASAKPKPTAKSAKPSSTPPAPPEAELEVPLPGGRRHVLSLAFVRDGDEFMARLETDSGQITELKNRSLDQLLTLVAGELEDLLE